MSLEIIMGPMFSGKTTHAISFIRRQKFIGNSIIALKPMIDTRYSSDAKIISHNKEEVSCLLWDHEKPLEFTDEFLSVNSIIIEEAQFFKGLLDFIKIALLTYKKNILVVGLDGDAQQQKFGEILDCIPYASNIQKLNALCVKCKNGTWAHYTKKLISDSEQIDVGSSEKYMSVCLKHLLS